MEPTANEMLSNVVPSNGMDAQSAIDKVISQRQTQNIGQTETGLDEAQSAINTVIQQRKSPKTQLNSTFASVSGINPDDAAKAQQVGGAIGLGQDLTMRNAAEVKRIADQKRFEMYDLMESDPILGRQMMRREFASVAHDDIPQLTSVGALFKVAYSAATLSPFPKDVALEISQQYEGTQYQTEEALIYHWMNNNNLEEKDLSEETRQRLNFLEQNAPPPINTYLFGGLSYAAGQARSMAPEVAKYAIAGGVTYGALGLAGGPLAPATVAGGVLTGIGLGATVGVGVVTSRIEGGMIYKDLLRSGVSKDVARTLASIGGTANGLVEIGTLGLATAPFKAVLKKVVGEQIIKRGIKLAKPTAIGAVKTAAKYYAMAVGGEQIQELSQETVSIIVEEIARSYAPGEYESKLATPEGRQELANRYLDVAEQTFKATAIMGSFGPMLNLAVDAKNIRDSAKTKQFLTDLSKNVQATKLKGRSPSALANFVAAQAKGTAAETMYVDAEEMANVLNQSGLTAQQIDNALPGVREQLSKATSGGDIQIPTAQFAANIVGTKLEAPLMEHARLAPDAISAKQAIVQQETMQQNMKDAQVEMAVQEKVNAQFVREAKEIEKVVNDQLVAAGRPPTEAAFAAKLVQARAVTGAAAAGITPAQWVAQHPVPKIQLQAVKSAQAQGADRADAQQSPVATQRPDDVVITGKSFQQEKDSGDFKGLNHKQAIELSGKKSKLKADKLKKLADDAPVGTTLNDDSGVGYWKKISGGAWVLFKGGANKLRGGGKFFESEKNPFARFIKVNYEYRFEYPAPEQQAPAQGSFEQASRADLGLGKPVGKQVVNIETNEFKDWFAGSVATVTKDGYPIKLYRWARSPFISPELDSVAGLAGQGSLLYGDGVTLTTEPMAALEFKGNPQDGLLLEVVTRIKNPLVIDAKGDSGFGIDAFNKAVAKLANISVAKLEAMAEKSLDKYNKFVTKTIRNAGYDGVHVKNAMQSDSGVMVDNWVPFKTQDVMTTNVATAQDAWNFEDAAFGQQDPNILRQEAIEKSATPKGFAKISAAAGIKANTKAAMGSKTKTGREFKLGIQKRVLDAAATAGIDLSVYTPEVRQYLISMAVSDAIAALDAGGSSAKAVGWYNEKVTKALRKIGLIHPEILTDPQAKFVFIWALATTSNGIKVDKNFRLAEEAYRYYKKSGKLPTNIGMGTSSAAINAGLQLFNKLSEKYSFEELETFFTTKHTVKEVDAFTGRGVSGENQTTIVYGSAALGAKVGNGFFSNLYGHFEQLTIDRWLMRTWGRWSGNLVEYSPKNVAIKQKQLKSLIALLSKSDSAKLSDIIGVNINTSSANTIATAIKKASSKEAIRIKIIQIASGEKLNKIVGILGEPKANAKRIGIGDEIRKTGNSLWGYLDGQKEQPEGAVERGRMRDVFAAALAVIQQRFPDLTMADLQAVLWYPEKNLYDTAKADEGVESTYEEDKAPDFDNAAQKLALELGVTKEQLDEVTAQVDRDIIAERGSRRPGRSLDSGGYDGGVGSSQVLNQSAVPATFYSALGVEVGKSTTKSASADSWKQQIKGLIAKGVVKEKEVYWSGLDNWLDLQEGKITKEQVQAFLDAGGVRVEVERSKDEQSASELTARQAIANAKEGLGGLLDLELENTFNEYEELVVNNLQNQETAKDRARRVELEEVIDEALDAVDMKMAWEFEAAEEQESASFANVFEPKYAGYQLPGGTNYREALVTLPELYLQPTAEGIAKRQAITNVYEPKILELEQKLKKATITKQFDLRVKLNSLKSKLEQERDAAYEMPKAPQYNTSHWDQSNVLVHLRMNDRVDADGKKVLFVEEVQSDWGQEGREKGFVDFKEKAALEKEGKELVKQSALKRDEALQALGSWKNKKWGTGSTIEILDEIVAMSRDGQEWADTFGIESNSDIATINDYIQTANKSVAVDIQLTKGDFGIPTAPFVETTSGWLELGLKQILLEAVNGGYDRVAFVDGDQSVQRYRKALTEAVDEVEITRNDNGTYTYSAIKGGKPVQGEQSVSAKRINEVFGKAGSKQLLEEADAKPDEIHTIASSDIEIGGEGMRKFYDTIVPQALSKMLKKLGGDKIENVNMITEKPVTQEQINAAEKRKDFTEAERLTAIYERQQLGRGISEKGDQQVGEQQGFTVTPALAEQVSQGLPLFQAAEGGARGEYDPIKNLIGIGKNADYSTVAHELAHWYVVDLFRTASESTASEASRSDADILLKWFGIAGDNVDQRLANWNAMTLDEQRRHHEAVAYNWELYLHTGKAPSVELQGVFDRFRRWLTRAYKSIRDDLNEIYKQQFGTDLPFMTDEVRGVFDRMLASEEQIARREAIDNFKGMYQTQEESGMNDATWAAYQAEIAEAHEMAVTDLTKATVKQMEWLSGARKGIFKAMQAAHNALRRSVQGEESNKMDNEPVRKAERFFKTGKMVDPDGKEIEVLVGNKIDSVAVGGMYPTSTTGLAPAVDLTKLRGMTMEGGLAPDLAAEMFGFSSGDELIRALAELKPFKDELKERTDARMLDEHGGMNTEAEKEEAVNKALANEVRARMVAIENRYLTKVKTPVAVIMQGAKELARTILGRMAIKDIKPRNYVAAEARVAKDKHTAVKAMQSPETAGKSAYTRSFNEQIAAGVEESVAASEALAKSVEAIKRAQAKIDAHKKQYGDVDPAIVAAKASHQQVIQGQLAKEGYKILEEVDKALAYVKRIVSDVNRKNMGADHADQIEAILERFGLMGRYVAPTTRTPLATWAQVQQDIGFDIEIPDIVQESVRKNFLELTPEEFQDVIDTVKQIAHTGKTQQLVLTMDRKVTFEKAKTEIVESINANASGRKAKTRTATTNIGRTIETLTGFFAAHLKAAIVAQIMDGGKDGGPLWNYLIRSANTAGNKETTMRAAATKRISEILDPVFKGGKMGGAGVYFPSVDRSFNRESVLTIALNMGNESNMQRLLDGEGWTIEQVMPIIQSLTAAELNAVQEVWDYSETFKAEIIEKSRRTVGREPNWIEPKPLQVMSADGQMVSLKGGYYPVKYDPRASARSQSLSAADQALRDLKDAHIASTTRRSYTKSRVKEVHDRPLLLNLSGLYSGIGEVIHDLSWHEWLIDSNRLMRSSAFDKAVREQYGVEFKDQITSWIKDVAAGDKGANNAGEMALNYLRQGVSAAGLGFNLMSAVGQITGFAQSVVKVGAKWIGRGIAVSASDPSAAIERVYGLSSFMANRGSTQFRELNEIKNMVRGENVAMKRVKAGTYFLMMQMQRMVDIPTWIGAYEKQLSINSDEKLAIAIADQAVIDSQGGGMLKDLSAIERGGPIQKLFTVFYSFMNTNLNLAVLKGMTEKNAGKWVAQQTMLWVVPVVTMYMLKKLLTPQAGDDDDKFDLKEMAKELAAEELSFLMGSFMVVREFADAAKIVTGAKTYGTDYRGPAGLRMIGDTYKFATQAAQLEFDTAFRKAAINIIGSSSGLPAAQINRTIDGIEALLEGETENITAPLFGVKKR
jgi:hypothetical protein